MAGSWLRRVGVLMACAVMLAACGGDTEQQLPTVAVIATLTPSSTVTSTPTPAATAIPTQTATPIPSVTPSPVDTATVTPTPTPTITDTVTPTPAPNITVSPTDEDDWNSIRSALTEYAATESFNPFATPTPLPYNGF